MWPMDRREVCVCASMFGTRNRSEMLPAMEARAMGLENYALAVRISSKGAELHSVVCEGIERMWSGDPAVGGRRAPLLFPLIGRLRDGWYANGGERVDAPMHGFCRDRAFAAEQVSGTHPRLETVSHQGRGRSFPSTSASPWISRPRVPPS